jgi:hypothetical protein
MSASRAAEKLDAARDDLHRAIALGGLQRDPLRHPLQALASVLDALEEAANAVREPVSPAAEAEIIRRLENAASRGAAQHAAALARTHNLRTMLIASAVLVSAVALSIVGGYWWGVTRPVQTNLGMLPREVALVLSSNDMSKALAECKPLPQNSGRRACAVNLWLEP